MAEEQKEKKGLKKEISFGGKPKGKAPTKTSMNLYVSAHANESRKALGIAAIIIVIIVVALLLFGVYGRYSALDDLRDQTSSLQSQVDTLEAGLTDYDQVADDYARYGDGYLSENDAVLVDRTKLIDLANKAVKGLGTIESLTMVDNEMTIVVGTNKLKDTAQMRTRIESSKYVWNVDVTTADSNYEEDATGISSKYDVIATLTVDVSQDGKEPVEEEDDSASEEEVS